VSGVVFLYGYLRAMVRREERVADPEFRAFVRRELRERARGEIAQRVSRRDAPVSVPASGH
jgi:hypothetical protein